MLRRLVAFSSLLIAFAAGLPLYAQGEFPEARRMLFLGDSITHAGGFVASIEAAAIVQFPQRELEIINAGLPSETVSGLSEPGHANGQFPRPDLHERLARVLEQVKPDLVIACYGMNDGIYYPLSEQRLAKFKSGIERLHEAVQQQGARIIHLTPAYFDNLPIKEKLLPAGLEEYRQPYVDYDEVLEAYSQWLLHQRQAGWEVYDVHSAMKQAVMDRRREDPNFTFAKDGVHPNADGQAVIARPLADAWGLQLDAQGRPVHPQGPEILKLVSEKQQVLKLAWLSATGHLRPGIQAGLPLPAAQAKAQDIDKHIRELLK